MSFSLSVYSVDLEKVTQAVGSRDQALLHTLQEEERARDPFGGYDDEDDEELTYKRALEQVIMEPGILDDPDLDNSDEADTYADSFEVLCQHFGTELNNNPWFSFGSQWFDDIVNKIAESHGPRLYVDSFLPCGFPTPSYLPMVALFTQNEVREVCESTSFAPKDDEVRECGEAALGWFRQARDNNHDLVIFMQ